MNKVIVIGGDHHNTLGVIRGLGGKGLKSDLILVSQSSMTYVDASKYISRCWKVSNDSMIVDILLSHYKNEALKPVVICCSDFSAGVIDENLNLLRPYFLLPGSSQQGDISQLMRKKRMAEIAIDIGLKTPNTIYIKNEEIDFDKIQLPCIIKPEISKNGKKTDISICSTVEELCQYVEHHDMRNYQIQQFVEKDFEYQLIGCSTQKEIIIPGVSKILRPCKGSNTSFLHYTPLETDFCEVEKCKEFVRRTGYCGLFSMEFIRDKNGHDFFLEINFRNDGNAICVTAAGMNLPFIWYLDCIGNHGEEYIKEINNLISPIYVMPDLAELKLLITRQISVRQYIVDLRKTNCFMEYDPRDKKPFLKLLKSHICLRKSI